MKTFRKTIVTLVALLLTCTPLGACKFDDPDRVEIDPDRTQIYVAVSSQGIDEKWLYPVIERFEKDYPEYQVVVDPLIDKSQSDADLAKSMPTSRDDLYFLQGGNCPFDWIDAGYIEDITDVVTVGDEAFDNGETIESKIINDHFRDLYRTEDDKYYFIPYVLATSGIVYDADLFEEYNLFNLSGYKGLDGISGNEDDKWGPDGKKGTYDDGLPAIWSDFVTLMSVMRQKGIIPFIWSGEHPSYRTGLAKAMVASYDGANQYEMYYTLKGHDDYSDTDITYQNANKLAQRPGQKAVYQAIYDICSNVDNFASESFELRTSHLGAQNKFILSCKTDKPIAMLIEGGWWENEAKGTFKEMERYGSNYGYGKRNFRYMPIPKFKHMGAGFEDQTHDEHVFYSTFSGSTVCMNKMSQNKDAAKLFLRYTHTNQSLCDFSLNNGLLRPYNYTFTDEQFNSLSYYGRSVWEAVRSEGTTIADGSILDKWVKQHPDLADGLILSTQLDDSSVLRGDPFDLVHVRKISLDKYMSGREKAFSDIAWAKKVANV